MERLRSENETLQKQLPDLEALRDRILKSLKLGTQAPGYRVAKKALDQLIKEISP